MFLSVEYQFIIDALMLTSIQYNFIIDAFMLESVEYHFSGGRSLEYPNPRRIGDILV